MQPLDYREQLMRNPLFANVQEEVVLRLLQGDGCTLRSYVAGETVSASGSAARRLGVVLAGEAQVYKQAGETRLLMSVLRPGNLLGAATLFLPGAQAVTEIEARHAATVLFFSEEALERAMRESFELTRNYLAYLTARVHFLTQRIESIACPTAADKLLNYLVQNAENGEVVLPHGMRMLSEALCMSRASLYRVMDDLIWAGKLERDGKTIRILCQGKEKGGKS